MNDYNLVLLRHGQSQWNLENRFTGWRDIDLSEKGKQEVHHSAQLLKKMNFQFELALTSFLKRAIRSLWIVLDELDQMWIPVMKSWRLNERHYGQLTGLNKKDMSNKYGARQVSLWRRAYREMPPPMEMPPRREFRYKDLFQVPLSESLEQTKNRVLPFWLKTAVPVLKERKKILIVAHGNSLRSLIMHIENMDNKNIMKVEVPTGIPIAYSLSEKTLEFKNKKIIK